MIKGLIATALLTSAAGAGIATTDLQPPEIYSALTDAGIELPVVPEKPDREAIHDMSEEEREMLREEHQVLVTDWLDLLDEDDREEFEARIADRQERRVAMRAEIDVMIDEEREVFFEERRAEREERRADREYRFRSHAERGAFAQ